MGISLFERLFALLKNHNFVVQYWNGKTTRYGDGEPEFQITFIREPSLQDLLEPPSLFFGKAYMRGDIELSGSHAAMAKALADAGDVRFDPKTGNIAFRALSAVSAAARSLARQKDDIAAHYDLGNDFFSLWLDRDTRSYSCAYFRNQDDSLETAQRQKTDISLKKLHLKPGMRLLDIGCGWGWTSLRAALNYGAKVLAITLSEEQLAAVRRLFAENGLGDSAEARLCNYLDLEPSEHFDRVVSIGMFEHVGRAHHAEYFAKVRRLLKPGGLSLLHTLTKNEPGESDPWINRYIFPGGQIPAISEVVSGLSEGGFHLTHVESLRRHYVTTLDRWHDNFSRPEVLEKVRRKFDNGFARMWSLYLRMASAHLDIGALDVHQFVFANGPAVDVPMTLEKVYA